ncbi:MAG: YihY/virulence factor BrkB family protein [Acidimicrobiia bacterium]
MGTRALALTRELQRRFSAERAGNLAAAISMRAFLALFPILVLCIAVVGLFVGDATAFADRVVSELGLTGDVAETITDATRTAQDTKVASSIIGIVGLLWTGTGLAASITDAWNQVWQIPGGTLRGRLIGVGWLAGGGVLAILGFGATGLVSGSGELVVVGIVGGLAVDTLLFLWTAWILPKRRIPIRAMLPAAFIGGIGYEILKLVGGYAVPAMVSRSSTLYGTIGVVFALLVWMLVLGYLVVSVALAEKVLWDQGASRSRGQEPPAARV